jgi:GMP synthase-like glutamine amidotransferase
MQWHEDTFDLPVGAAALATGERYANQAFRVGTRAWGLQFHLEVDQALADWLVDTGTAEATAAGVDPEAIRTASPRALAEIEPHREVIFGRFAALVARA